MSDRLVANGVLSLSVWKRDLLLGDVLEVWSSHHTTLEQVPGSLRMVVPGRSGGGRELVSLVAWGGSGDLGKFTLAGPNCDGCRFSLDSERSQVGAWDAAFRGRLEWDRLTFKQVELVLSGRGIFALPGIRK